MIKASAHQEDKTELNVYAQTNSCKTHVEKLIDQRRNRQIQNYHSKLWNFSVIDKTLAKISKIIGKLNKISLIFTDHSARTNTFTGAWDFINIDTILGRKAKLNRWKILEIIQKYALWPQSNYTRN